MKMVRLTLVVLWLLAVLGGPLTAQSTGPVRSPALEGRARLEVMDEAQELFLDNITVNVVNIEVVVTDKKGKQVRGLVADDFELFEDKRPMEISNFYAVDGGVPRADMAGGQPVPGDEGIPGVPLEALTIPEDQRLNLIIFIDHFNIHALNRNRVMRDVRQFLLQTIKSEDRVMLMTYTRSLKVEQRFTSDPRLVSAALSSLEKNSGFANLRDTERQEVMRNIEDARSGSAAFSFARSYAESVFNDLTFTIKNLKQLVEQLAGLPGRKMVLHVSDGIPMVAAAEIFELVDGKYPGIGAINETFNYDTSRQFQQLVASANANRVTFNTLDAAGLRTSIFTDASHQGGVGRGNLDSTLIHNLQDTLHILAEGTGGRAIVNRNRPLAALREVAEDFRNFYSLGFSPSHAGTGRLYRIRVRLKDKAKRKAYDVRYRDSYRDKSVETRMSDGTLAALNFSYEANTHGVKIEFGTPKKQSEGRHFLVPIDIRIPLGKVTLVPVEGSYQGRVRLFIAAMDSDGGKSPVEEASVPISIPAKQLDPEGRQQYVYSVELLMRKGGHEVAVGMRDDLAGSTSFVRRRIRVGARG